MPGPPPLCPSPHPARPKPRREAGASKMLPTDEEVRVDIADENAKPAADENAKPVYRELVTPRCAEEEEEQLEEYRSTNKKDDELWQEMKAKYPFLADWADSLKKFSSFCQPRSYGHLKDGPQRRDFSHLARLADS